MVECRNGLHDIIINGHALYMEEGVAPVVLIVEVVAIMMKRT